MLELTMWASFRSNGRKAVSAASMMDTQSSDVAQRSIPTFKVSIVPLHGYILVGSYASNLQLEKAPFPEVTILVKRPMLMAMVITPSPKMTARPIFSLRLGSFRSRMRGKGKATSTLLAFTVKMLLEDDILRTSVVKLRDQWIRIIINELYALQTPGSGDLEEHRESVPEI